MPAIKSYNSPNAGEGLRINNSGIGAVEGEAASAIRAASLAERNVDATGRAIGSAIKTTGEVAAQAYEQYYVQPEISKGAAALAGYQDDLTTKWNTLAKSTDPNDASIKQKFLTEELEPALQKFNDSFQTADGKKFAEAQSNQFRKHMFEKTTADSATRAGEAIVANMNTFKNTLSNTVRTDPSAYDHSASLVDASIKEQIANTPGLSVATAAKIEGTLATNIKAELAKATILGVAEKNPDAAQKMIDSGKFNTLIDGTEMSNMVKTMKNASRADQNFARIEKERQEAAVSEARADNYITKLYSGKGPLPSVKEIALDPELNVKDRKMLIETAMKRSEQTPDAPVVKDNAEKVGDLMSRLTDPNAKLTLSDLLLAARDGDITDATFNRLNSLRQAVDAEPLKDPAIKSTFDAVEAKLTNKIPGMNNTDPKGAEAVSRWKLMALPKIIEMQKAGKLTAADMDLSDPNSFISKSIKPYTRDLPQKLADFNAEFASGGLKVPGATSTAAPVTPAKEYGGLTNVPPDLKGIAALSWSEKTQRYYDTASGKAYDKTGKEIK